MWQKVKSLFDKVWRFICGIPKDKLLHIIAGLITAAFFAITLNMTICIIPVIFIAFGREFYKIWVRENQRFDVCDFIATLAGGSIIQIFVIL